MYLALFQGFVIVFAIDSIALRIAILEYPSIFVHSGLQGFGLYSEFA